MKLRLKAYAVQSNQIKKIAANPNIVPGRAVNYKTYYKFKVIGLSSDREGWVLEAGPDNFYKIEKDPYAYLIRNVTKKEYFFCKFNIQFPWNEGSRYLQFDFDHPIYDEFETKAQEKFVPLPYVPQKPLPKAKYLFTYVNETLVKDQNLTTWPREGEKFVSWIQELINSSYAKNKTYPYPVNELVASRLTLNPTFGTVEYREKGIPTILKPSSIKWKNQLQGIETVFIFWSWALKTIEGMLFNEMITKQEFKKAKTLIYIKFQATKKMRNIFKSLEVPEQM